MSKASFIDAMDLTHQEEEAVGVNGSDVYTKPVGDSQELLALFGSLNRTMSPGVLEQLLEEAYVTATFADLVVLAFHTRDILEGKGERALFYRMLWFLYQKRPSEVLKVLRHISEYGAWLDLQKFLEHGAQFELKTEATEAKAKGKKETQKKTKHMMVVAHNWLVKTVVNLYAQQLLADANAEKNLSLAAKWMPRENKQHGWLAPLVASAMFKCVTKAPRHQLKLFRQHVSALNGRIDTVERKMCHDAQKEHHFAAIDPAKVPGRCLLLKRPAFFNEAPKGKGTAAAELMRHPDNPDRMACRDRFLAHMAKALKGKAKVHGKVIMPHEFIVAAYKLDDTTGAAWDTLQAQWNDMRAAVLARGALGNMVVMCDFSGSMSGMPMDVSKGLGLLCAECTSPAFRHRLLTFDSTPTWHNLERVGPGLKERIRSFVGVSQGLTTNFQAAVDLVLNRLVECKVPVGSEPDVMLVITDMGWDAANNMEGYHHYHQSQGLAPAGKFETHIDRIKRNFAAKGGWKVPNIVIWNVSGKFQEYHHKADTPGVCVVSGWSPTILKYILQGDNLIEKLSLMTPAKIMRDVLDADRYTPIRDTLKVQPHNNDNDTVVIVDNDVDVDVDDWGHCDCVDCEDWPADMDMDMPPLIDDEDDNPPPLILPDAAFEGVVVVAPSLEPEVVTMLSEPEVVVTSTEPEVVTLAPEVVTLAPEVVVTSTEPDKATCTCT